MEHIVLSTRVHEAAKALGHVNQCSALQFAPLADKYDFRNQLLNQSLSQNSVQEPLLFRGESYKIATFRAKLTTAISRAHSSKGIESKTHNAELSRDLLEETNRQGYTEIVEKYFDRVAEVVRLFCRFIALGLMVLL